MMRTWSTDHPKARLLERKQQAILDAAGQEFMRAGYAGTSMELIAKVAGVSIATLYRHAPTKDDLFRAIISRWAEAELFDEEELRQLVEQPLRDALVVFGMRYLGVQLAPDRIALQRMVIAEIARFPYLGEVAYRAGIGGASALLGDFLTGRSDNALWGRSPRDAARRFLGMLAGNLQMRALLGMSLAATVRSKPEYAARVVDAFLGNHDLGAVPGRGESPAVPES
jgi:TetR/AcrR family transcriptional repressor of mexJK operon